MPAYNHIAEDLIARTNSHVVLDQEGNFSCKLCRSKVYPFGEYIGRSTMEVQRHFEEEHDFEFTYPPETENHRMVEGA